MNVGRTWLHRKLSNMGHQVPGPGTWAAGYWRMVLCHLLQKQPGPVNFPTRLRIFYSKTTLCWS